MKPQFPIKLKFLILENICSIWREVGHTFTQMSLVSEGKLIVETTINMLKAPITASFKS